MRNVGNLIFAFVVLVGSIVCPRGIFPVGEHPNDIISRSNLPIKVVRMRAEDLPGVYAMYGPRHGFELCVQLPVRNYLDVVISGTTILGADELNELIPIWCYDDTGPNFCTMQVGEEGQPAHTLRTYKYRYGETTFGMYHKLPESTRYHLLLRPLKNRSRSRSRSPFGHPPPSGTPSSSSGNPSVSNQRVREIPQDKTSTM